MSSASEDECSQNWSDNWSDNSFQASSEVSEDFFSASEYFLQYQYDNVEAVEPIATEEEVAVYAVKVAEEVEEEEILWSRFFGEEDIENWCQCSNCSLELVTKYDECRCCIDVDRCRARMDEVDLIGQCITQHPGFTNVCLNRWVLRTAGIGLKTKKKKSYSTVFAQGDIAEHEFLRSVAYRQFVRLVWKYLGASKRIPLPCCVYNSIRKTYPTEAEHYQGYEEDESD